MSQYLYRETSCHLDDTAGRHTWATNIKDLLFLYGFGYAWLAQEVGNENMFLRLFCQRVKDIFTQKWFSGIESTPKAHHYKYFKTNLAPEHYLSLDISYVYKKMLSNFRCSNHDLMIEKGRHLGIDRQLRIYPICNQKNLNIIEDEFHLFFECMVYDNLRLLYFNKNWLRNRNRNNFHRILELKDRVTILKVSKILIDAFNLQKVFIENQ